MLKAGYGVRELPANELLDAGQGMFEQAHAQAGLNALGEMDLDTELLRYLATIGHLITVGAFDEDELVGYCVLVIGPNIRRRGSTMAQLISIFVEPEHRGRGLCEEMLDAAEQSAIDRKIEQVVWIARRDSTFMTTLMRRHMDDRQEVAFVRDLR